MIIQLMGVLTATSIFTAGIYFIAKIIIRTINQKKDENNETK